MVNGEYKSDPSCSQAGIPSAVQAASGYCHCLVTQSCLTLCHPMNCSPPGSSVHGVSKARILEQVAISFSRGSSPPRDQTHGSCQVSCVGRQILYRWATWEAHTSSILVVPVQSLSNNFWPHALQHTRLPCPSPSLGVCSNSCPLSRWCYLTISSSATLFSFCIQSFLASGYFSNESALSLRWPKYWSFSFSFSLSNEYSGLISFRIDRFDLLVI